MIDVRFTLLLGFLQKKKSHNCAVHYPGRVIERDPHTDNGVPNSWLPKFKSQSQMNIWDVNIKAYRSQDTKLEIFLAKSKHPQKMSIYTKLIYKEQKPHCHTFCNITEQLCSIFFSTKLLIFNYACFS